MSRARLPFIIVALLATAGCPTRRSSEVCCNTAVECDEFGLDGITACEGVKVCIEGSCESPTCETSADCAAPSPYCVNTSCVGACSGDPSCVGAGAGPYCAPDGACVDCLDDAQCGAATPVCDAATHNCRACTADNECSSGICLAAAGRCLDPANAVFVASDGLDLGECTAAAPCASVSYALPKITSARPVLRIPSIDYPAGAAILVDRDVYIDAADTRISAGVSPALSFSGNVTVTVEGIRLRQEGMSVASGARVTSYETSVEQATITVDGATTELRFQHGRLFADSWINCTGLATVEVSDSDLDVAKVVLDGCAGTIRRSTLRPSDAGSAIWANVILPVVVENNVLFAPGGSSQGKFLNASGGASSWITIRYNTLIVEAPTTAVLVGCAAQGVISSNLFVARSPNILGPSTCPVDHSIFDDATGAPPGVGNSTAPEAEMLPGLASEDYTPGAPARGAGNPDEMPVDDLFGNPRPMPAGSDPDIGAVEAP